MDGSQALSTPPVDPAVGTQKVQKLAQNKRLALYFLLVACVVFVVTTALDPHHLNVWVGLVTAMSEAAMVGGLADWFAVTALFRHPLGQRWIPHTAIIPKSKDKIGKSLADFICDHFMDGALVLQKVRDFDPADRLAKALSREDSAAALGDFVVKHAPRLVELLDSDELQEFVRSATRDKLRAMDVAGFLADLLALLTAEGRHHELVDSLLKDVADLAGKPGSRQVLAKEIAPELWAAARWVQLDKPIADNIAEKVTAGFQRLVQDVARDRNHELRVGLDREIPKFINRLRSDDDLRAKVAAFRDGALDKRELSDYIADLWSGAMAWLRADLDRPTSSIRQAVLQASMSLGARLDADAELKGWLNRWILETVAPLVQEYREKIRGFIVARVEAWSVDELTAQLEVSVGSDLQFIRISGTVVGAAIGGLLFALMHLVRFIAG